MHHLSWYNFPYCDNDIKISDIDILPHVCIRMIILHKNVILVCFVRVFTVILVGSISFGHYTLYFNLVFCGPLSFKVIYRDNYHIMINFVCNNHDRKYIKYFISHITNKHCTIYSIKILLLIYHSRTTVKVEDFSV